MLLQKNETKSSTKRTKHINMRYYFIHDRWKQGDFKIEYCSTDEMLADYFTKPVQGKKFIKFRNMVLGMTQATID